MIGDERAIVRQRLEVLLLPGFVLTELALLLDILREANSATDPPLYSIRRVSIAGETVPDAGGLSVPVDGCFEPTAEGDLLWVFAGSPPAARSVAIGTINPLRQGIDRRRMVVGVGPAVFWLAQAGVLAGHKVTVPWRLQAAFKTMFPQLAVCTDLYLRDKRLATCGGGAAVADLALHLLAERAGAELAARVAEALVLDRVRGPGEHQRIPLRSQLGAAQPKLVRAVQLMEANLEEPLTTDTIAERVAVSRRQLERLFKQHLDKVPSQFYLELRLNRARQKLRESNESIIQIGLSCGFSSGPHFSSAYRNHFGITPREDRRRAVLGHEGGCP